MLTKYIALVSKSENVKPRQLMAVCAALQKQVTRDFGPIWEIEATVNPFADLEDVPLGHWPLIVMDDINDPSAAGVHEDHMGQPFALIQAGSLWPLTASHECLEMLADPFGNRTVGGYAPRELPDEEMKKQSVKYPVEFLVEVCDPCEDILCAYPIDDIPVSDFYTPHYFDPNITTARYDFAGHITKPRQVLKNGYLSWYDPAERKWYQHTYFETKPVIAPMKGVKFAVQGMRQIIDQHTPTPLEQLILDTRRVPNEMLTDWMDGINCPVLVACASAGQALRRSMAAGRVLADRGKSHGLAKLLKGAQEFETGRENDALSMRADIKKALQKQGT
jgi:hypothetical protein